MSRHFKATDDAVAAAVAAIRVAQDEWTSCDWTHDDGSRRLCDGGRPEDCAYCASAAADALSAAALGGEAIEALLGGDFGAALAAVEAADALERAYGDDPSWHAALVAVTALVEGQDDNEEERLDRARKADR